MKRILVDHRKCVACKGCELACGTNHHPTHNLFLAVGDRETEVNVRVLQVGHEAFPLSCRHCDPADCADACPAGAISRNSATGAVVIDSSRCKACAMCAMVCPFDAISFQVTHAAPHGRDVAHKCDLCSARVEAGRQPACVDACHSGALVFAEVEEFRLERGRRNLRTYLMGLGPFPPHIEAFRELRRNEAARRGGGAP